jgi:predicted aminopeptidase
MTILAILCFIAGGVFIWLSSRNTSQQLRKIGLGFLIAGVIVLALGWFDVPLMPE